MTVDVFGAAIVLAISVLVIAVIWQDKIQTLGLTLWQVY